MLPSQTIKWLQGLKILNPRSLYHDGGVLQDQWASTELTPISLPSKSDVQMLQMIDHHLSPRPDDFGTKLIVEDMDEHDAIDLLARYAKDIELTRGGERDSLRIEAYLTGTYEIARRVLELLGNRVQWTFATDAETWYDAGRDENLIRAKLTVETEDPEIVREVCEKFRSDMEAEKRGAEERQRLAAEKKREAAEARLATERLKVAEEAVAREAARIERERMDKYAEEAMF